MNHASHGGTAIVNRPPDRKRVVAALILVLLASAGIRAYLIATTEIVARDGITFVTYAQGLRTNPLAEMRSQAQHPLYPFTILLVHSLAEPWLHDEPVFSWPLAGQIASMLAGLLAVCGAYALGKVMWDARVGVITALFAGMLPPLCQVSGNALSDGLHLALYLWGLVALLHARCVNRLPWAAVAALCSGLAFLTRPEGGSVLLVGLTTTVWPPRPQQWSWRRRLMGIGLMLLCFALVAGPYMIAVGRVVKKKNVFELFGLEEWTETASTRVVRPSPVDTPSFARAGLELPIALEVPYQWGRCLRVIYLLLALPALTLRWVPRPRGLWTIALAWLLHMGLLYALAASFGYVSLRHLLIPAALTLPFSAATFAWLVDQASIRVASRHARRARVVRPIIYLVGALVVVAPTARWMLRPIGGGSGYIIKAGRWLHEHAQPSTMVLTTRRRVAYYAELPMWLGPDTGSVDEIADYVRQMDRGYFIVEQSHVTSPRRNPNFFEDLAASPLRQRLRLIHEEPGRGGKVLIYEITPPTTTGPTTGSASLALGRRPDGQDQP